MPMLFRGSRCRDHPRVCGEHPFVSPPPATSLGSSPRMRGARERYRIHPPRHGIIPAYAGSTSGHTRPINLAQDHPRVCGEHEEWCVDVDGEWGSSPRMRGAPISTYCLSSWSGIIPAYAGSTQATELHCCVSQDHPRVCGEHAVRSVERSPFLGSSPRMRGALPHLECAAVQSGIIPAYAGSTGRGQARRIGFWDHPRVCGEHTSRSASQR